MNFSEVYTHMNEPLLPSPALVERTLAKVQQHRRPWRRAAAAALAAALLLVTPTLAVRTEGGYELLYQLSPAMAQFFQPVQKSCTDRGVTIEVAAVRVEGDTAQAYITLTGGPVDETTDLFDSWSFHLPFDQSGRCERLSWDPETGTITFLCTVQTLDGSPIPTGEKMTFSVRQLLAGKETLENAAVELELAAFTAEAETVPVGGPENAYFCTGGSGEAGMTDSAPMLLPGPALAEPAPGLTITAAGYSQGQFHVQLCRGDAARLDNHAWLWLEAEDGTRLEPLYSASFAAPSPAQRQDYTQFIFDVSPEELAQYTLRGDFHTASALTEGLWQVTFPLEDKS